MVGGSGKSLLLCDPASEIWKIEMHVCRRQRRKSLRSKEVSEKKEIKWDTRKQRKHTGKQTNERTNEQTNERTNEQTTKGRNERTNKQTNRDIYT